MPEFLLHRSVQLREGAERPQAVPDVLEYNGPVSAARGPTWKAGQGKAEPRAPRSPRRRVPPLQGGSAGGATCTAALISRSNLTISWWHTRTGMEPTAAAAILGVERQGLERPLLAPRSAPRPSRRGGVLQSSSVEKEKAPGLPRPPYTQTHAMI